MFKPTPLREEVKAFTFFLLSYVRKKTLLYAHAFEYVKSLIVALLITKRGKYQSSFLNASFLLFVVTIWVAGPIIAENNPLLGSNLNQSSQKTSPVVSIYSLGGDNDFITTRISRKPRDRIEYYPIKAGDTLASIAKKFDVSVNTIKWANDLKTDTIAAGKQLKIPPVTGIVHKVESGDSVYTIAKKYGTDAQKIVNFPFNDFVDQDTFALATGQVLFVPDGTPPAEIPIIRPIYQQYFAGQGGSGSFIWPATGTITQYPIWYHMALDIANPASPPVIAADSGTVSFANCLNWGYGCHVIINHDNGFQSLYAHLWSYSVSVGQNVGKGEAIGVMGNTGRSTGTHLHFEIRQNGVLLNPSDFLR